MISLLRVLIIIVPVTVVYAIRIAWAVMRDAPDAKCVCEAIPRKWAKVLLKAARVDVVLENAEVIDPEAPQVMVANHSSWFDVLALSAFMPGPYAFVAKQEISRVPFFGPSVGACGHIYIDRSDRQKAMESLDRARKRLEEDGPTVIMFPEGTRSATGEVKAFKKGAFVLAIQTGTEVVPTAIFGAREAMKKGSLLVHPGTVRIRFGTPISVEGLQVDDRNELTRRAREALIGLLGAEGTTHRTN